MRMSRKVKTVLLSIIGLMVIRYTFFRAPSESQMLAHFRTHKTEFEQLRSMLQQDKQISIIGSDWMRGRDMSIVDTPEQMGISVERLAQYRALMNKLGVAPISGFGSRENYFQFNVFGGGFTDTTWSIGYAWSSKTPENIVPSAYNSMPRHRCHSRIVGDWYIFHRR